MDEYVCKNCETTHDTEECAEDCCACEGCQELEKKIADLMPYLAHGSIWLHTANCRVGKRKWNKGKYEILPCECGLDAVLARLL